MQVGLPSWWEGSTDAALAAAGTINSAPAARNGTTVRRGVLIGFMWVGTVTGLPRFRHHPWK